ncbi:hypothetical protein D9M69_683970 [compost metagenome]
MRMREVPSSKASSGAVIAPNAPVPRLCVRFTSSVALPMNSLWPRPSSQPPVARRWVCTSVSSMKFFEWRNQPLRLAVVLRLASR